MISSGRIFGDGRISGLLYRTFRGVGAPISRPSPKIRPENLEDRFPGWRRGARFPLGENGTVSLYRDEAVVLRTHKLGEADRIVRLRDRLEADLPVASDGSIELEARAWAVRGLVPG